MDVPFQEIPDAVDVRAVASQDCRCQIVLDHGLDRVSAFAPGVRVTGSLAAVFQRHGGGHQLEMRVVAVPGVRQHFRQRNDEETRCNGCYFHSVRL